MKAEQITGEFESISVEGVSSEFQYELSQAPDGSLQILVINEGVPTSMSAAPLVALDNEAGVLIASYPQLLDGWRMQESNDLIKWVDLPELTRWAIDADKPAVFFRLRRDP